MAAVPSRPPLATTVESRERPAQASDVTPACAFDKPGVHLTVHIAPLERPVPARPPPARRAAVRRASRVMTDWRDAPRQDRRAQARRAGGSAGARARVATSAGGW